MREINLIYEGRGKFHATSTYWEKRCDELFADGEQVLMHEDKERSSPSHRQFFAVLNDAYANLPEIEAKQYPTKEIFRGMLLIEAGHFMERRFCAETANEAERIATFLKSDDRVQVIVVQDTWVVERTPVSQSFDKMDHTTFQKVRDDIIAMCADKLGITVEELMTHGGHAA